MDAEVRLGRRKSLRKFVDNSIREALCTGATAAYAGSRAPGCIESLDRFDQNSIIVS